MKRLCRGIGPAGLLLSAALLAGCSIGEDPYFTDAQGRKCTYEGLHSVDDDHAVYGWEDASGVVHECTRPGSESPTQSRLDAKSDSRQFKGSEGAGAISPADADKYIGQQKKVCGTIDSVGGGGVDPVFLNFGAPYPNQDFTIVLWDESSAPLRLIGEERCATGQIVDYRGTPQIQFDSLDQVK